MESLKFEQALERLESIVNHLESGNTDLEESIKLFEEGIELSVYCQQELRKADGKVRRLSNKFNGDFELELFDIDDDKDPL